MDAVGLTDKILLSETDFWTRGGGASQGDDQLNSWMAVIVCRFSFSRFLECLGRTSGGDFEVGNVADLSLSGVDGFEENSESVRMALSYVSSSDNEVDARFFRTSWSRR